MLPSLRDLYRTRRSVRVAVELAAALALVFGISAYQSRHHLRGPAPEAPLRTLDGSTTALTAWRGRTTVLEVWAPWCTVCKVQTDNLARARGWLGARANVVSVAAAYENLDEVRRAVRDHAIDVPVLLGDEGFTRRLGVRAFPTVFVLDAQGRVVSSTQGYTSTLGLVLRAWWYG